MAAKDPTVRALVARIASNTQWATCEDRAAATAPACAAFLDRFEREVDPECVLPSAERSQRAEHARRAYFAKLALKSVQARQSRRQKQMKGA